MNNTKARFSTNFSRAAIILAVALTFAACEGDDSAPPSTHPDLADADVVKGIPEDLPSLPPFYSEVQCASLRRSFPGWNRLPNLPETDSKDRPTLWYAIIPITAKGQVEDLTTVGIDVMTMPLIVDEATDPQATGQRGLMTKSTCENAELHWAVIPGLTYNTIKEQTLALGEELVESIILLPVPDDFADLSITGPGGTHPLSYEILAEAGYHFTGLASRDPSTDPTTETKQGALFGWIKKKVVAVVAAAVQKVPNLAERGLAVLDKAVHQTVSLRVRLDVRNTDTTFGGDMGDVPGGASDKSTPMLRGWGPQAGAPLDLAGVTVAATQITLSIKGRGVRTRVEDDANETSIAQLTIVKNKRTGFCLETETSAVEMTDFLNEMEICDFQKDLVAPSGAPFGDNTFDKNTSIVIRLQNKYFNVLAQMNDGQKFARDVYKYDPHKASLLTGRMANLLIPFKADRLVTPCLGFPNLGVDLASLLAPLACIGAPFSTTAAAACPVGLINSALNVYDVDMWMPTGGIAESERRLEDRALSTHEYGHFVMCSMLFDADWTKMRQIPSLIVQRMEDGSYLNANDESSIVTEAWADYFATQLTGGANYFAPEHSVPSLDHLVAYCDASSSSCLDLNYVEDNDNTDDGSGVRSIGFAGQVRQTVSVLIDAFDGDTFGTNVPNSADLVTRTGLPSPVLRLSVVHNGDSHDEPITLPGSALRTIVDRWVEMNDVSRWKVNRQQFHAAVTEVMRESKHSWCDTCRVYAPHDGKSCAFAPAAIQERGECRNPTTKVPIGANLGIPDMINICTQAPVSTWVGPAPSPTDPSADCTFTGCPPHQRLVGTPGSQTSPAICSECGPRQVSTGSVPCANCAIATVPSSGCTTCSPTQIVGGPDRNTCVDCSADSAPNGAASCQLCGMRSVPQNGVCVACANDEIETPEHSCVTCPPEAPFRLDNTCVASCDCKSGAAPCLVAQGSVCVASPCPAHQIRSGSSCVACPSGAISVEGTKCVGCDAAKNLFQSDNQCVACPGLNIAVPFSAPTACTACPRGSVPFNATCVVCPVNQVSGKDNQCHFCPSGQLPLGDTCIPTTECVSSPRHCGRVIDPRGFCNVVVC